MFGQDPCRNSVGSLSVAPPIKQIETMVAQHLDTRKSRCTPPRVHDAIEVYQNSFRYKLTTPPCNQQVTVVIVGLVLWTVSKRKTYGLRNLKRWESQEELWSALDIRPHLASTEEDLLSTTHHNSFTSYSPSSSLHRANMPGIRSTACALAALAVHLCNAKDWEGPAYDQL